MSHPAEPPPNPSAEQIDRKLQVAQSALALALRLAEEHGYSRDLAKSIKDAERSIQLSREMLK